VVIDYSLTAADPSNGLLYPASIGIVRIGKRLYRFFLILIQKMGTVLKRIEKRGIWLMSIIRFTPYPFQVGQKIHICEGSRKGDWEVISVDEKKVGLRCPVTGFEAHWARFCYFVEEKDTPWPVSTEKDDK